MSAEFAEPPALGVDAAQGASAVPPVEVPPVTVMWHGTDAEAADAILRDGFKAGTYFARHLEDALGMGGDVVFTVYFPGETGARWQYVTSEPIPPGRILSVDEYTKRTLYQGHEAQIAVKSLWVKAQYGDSRVVCRHCRGRGQMNEASLHEMKRTGEELIDCPVCHGHGNVPAGTRP